MKNTIVKDAISLTIITLVAGALLGFAYDVTKAPIEQAEYEKKQKAYQAVFIEATTFEMNEEIQTIATSKQSFAEGVTGVYISEVLEAKNGDGELFVLETDEEYDMINEVIDQFYEDQLQNADEE